MKRWFALLTAAVTLGVSLVAAEAGPLSPMGFVTSAALGGRAHELILDGNLAYVTTDVGLAVVDITNPDAPTKLSSVALGGIGYGLAQKDKLVFATNVKTGLRVIDVSKPDAPVIVGSKVIPGSGGARDVAIKGDIAYVAGYAGEVHVIRFVRKSDTEVTLTTLKTLGILAWGSPGSDAVSLAKMGGANPVTNGNGKVTGLAVTGNTLVVPEFAYGRLFFYDVSNAASPILKGSHDQPYTFRALIDSTESWAFGFTAYSAKSGTYSVSLDHLTPGATTYHDSCVTFVEDPCDYIATPATDYGGIGLTDKGYVIALGGKQGVLQLIDARDPSNMVEVDRLPIVGHQSRLMEFMGAQVRGEYIYATVGALGLRIYKVTGITID